MGTVLSTGLYLIFAPTSLSLSFTSAVIYQIPDSADLICHLSVYFKLHPPGGSPTVDLLQSRSKASNRFSVKHVLKGGAQVIRRELGRIVFNAAVEFPYYWFGLYCGFLSGHDVVAGIEHSAML